MKKTILMASIIAASSLSTTSHAEINFDANIELDTTVTDTAESSATYDQSGRVQLNIGGRHEVDNYFVAAKGTVNLGVDSNTGVDDAYIMLGSDVWDAQLGRFEAVNLFPLGKDTLVSHAGGVSVYEANMVRGRAGDDGGQIALHYNPGDNLKMELTTIFGDDDTAGDNATAISGYRPSITWSSDGLSLTAGYESVKYDLTAGGKVDKSGYAVTANFDMGEANANVAAARMKDETSDEKVTSYAANFTYGNFGAGVVLSKQDKASGADPEVATTYVAYTVPVFDIENASVTFAGSYSKADNVTDEKTVAGRVRLNYTF